MTTINVRLPFETCDSFPAACAEGKSRWAGATTGDKVVSYLKGGLRECGNAVLSVPKAAVSFCFDFVKVCECALKVFSSLRDGKTCEAGVELCKRVWNVLTNVVYVPVCVLAILIPGIRDYLEATRSDKMICDLSAETNSKYRGNDAAAAAKAYDDNHVEFAKLTAPKADELEATVVHCKAALKNADLKLACDTAALTALKAKNAFVNEQIVDHTEETKKYDAKIAKAEKEQTALKPDADDKAKAACEEAVKTAKKEAEDFKAKKPQTESTTDAEVNVDKSKASRDAAAKALETAEEALKNKKS